MKNKQIFTMVISALLLAMGLVFHTIIPGVFFGMKPDFILIFMFIAFILNPTYPNAVVIGVAGGVLSGLTTSFPGGFLPNLIDKPITMTVVFITFALLNKVQLFNRFNFDKNYLLTTIIGIIGTLTSGVVFLGSATIIVGLPAGASFAFLFYTVVLTTTVINAVLTPLVYVVMNAAARRSNRQINDISTEFAQASE
jgi:Tryptophan transporter TrpP